VKVLHIIDTIGVGGGAETIVAETINEMDGIENVLVTLYPYHKEFSVKVTRRISLKWKSFFSLPLAVIRLKRVLHEEKVDIIHAHLFWSSVVARLCKRRGVKLVVSLHSMLGVELFNSNKVLRWLERLTAAKQDAVIAVSKNVLEDYSRFISYRGRKYVLYNFIADKFFNISHPGYEKNVSDKKCIAVGHFKPAKNYFYLLNSFQRLKNKNFHLDIYGEGPLLGQMEDYIQTHNISNVRIAGLCPDMNSVLQKYDVFISVSRHEGFGLAMLEAMASRVPCIVSDIPVYREVAGDNCFFINIYNENALAEQLSAIFDEPALLNQFVQKAAERAFEIGSKEKYFSNLLNVYSLLLRNEK
jgi:glycosyltransferase involved in cell wall biosynthesis